MGARLLTAERLREVLDYDPETGLFVWKMKTADCVHVGSIAGGMDEKGYIRMRVDGRRYRAHRLAWLWMTGEWPSRGIDHRDTDRANNRWANLRVASSSQNIANSRLRSDNTSGFKGVSKFKNGQWRAEVGTPSGRHYLGLFPCPAAAHLAYVVAAAKYHGEFARAA